MSVSHSNAPTGTGKPAKPDPNFPLFPHAAGVWAKKIRGKMHYFGPWDDPDGALKKYLEQKDALHAGRKPRSDTEGLTIKALANEFLNHKKALLEAGELSTRTWDEYKETTDLLVSAFGKSRLVVDIGPDDFAALRKRMAKRWGPTRLGNAIQRTRSVFKFAADNDLIERPMRYGQGFQRPSAKTLRLHKAKQGPKLFTAGEIHQLLDAADVQLKAMILLGINCGFGMADCGRLPLSALDLERGWVDYPRSKTGVARRCPLWQETAAAVKAALAVNPKPKREEHAGLVFLTRQGQPWHKEDASGPMCCKFGRLLRRLHIDGRQGLGFYTLRHVFRTIADEAGDQPSADLIMGHAKADMASVYRETISNARLQAVTNHVHGWLFAQPTKTAGDKE